ncbi:cobalamin-binding protein [uncultured Halopseudomonas sp.]|uniref:cobalamin-binding protein n=1 Tax=uncultured Halopseudomonas sp. TaxID=2901193 RepID=UPI0030EC88A1|tara:strand:+ start:1852 stop:2709 length:858 start_codon:yes stop_codon:yes gene_type:complete
MRRWLAALVCLWLASGQASASGGEAQRIVSLAPFLTDMLVQLDVSDRLVGVLDDGLLDEKLDSVKRVGGYQTLSRELILSQKPDLVLAWTSGNDPQLLAQLENWGLQVERFDPQRLADIAGMTRELGLLLGVSGRAEQLAVDFEQALVRLQRPINDDAPRVFVQLWDNPLYTVSDQQLIGDALRHCGARNIFGELSVLAPQVGRESVIAADPDLIIVFADEPAQANPWLQRWRQFPQMRAVRNNGLKSLDGDSLVKPTPQLAEGLEGLCNLVWSNAAEKTMSGSR